MNKIKKFLKLRLKIFIIILPIVFLLVSCDFNSQNYVRILQDSPIEISIGSSFQLDYECSSNLKEKESIWQSNSECIQVDESGLIIAKDVGRAVVTLKVDNYSDSINVHVIDTSIYELELSASKYDIYVGERIKLNCHLNSFEDQDINDDVFIKLEIGLFVLIVILLTSSFIVRKLIVKPLLTYNEGIEKDQVFPVIGTFELQTLAENYNKVYEDNQETQRLIRHDAEHDALTGLLNRGSFNKVLPIYLNGEVPFSLILLDIDTFKFYNDNYGRQLGDEVIKIVASQLENTFSTKDYVFRIGGDEFAIIVVEMPSANKDSISERLEKLKIELIKSEKDLPPVTISAGITFSDYEGENKMDVFRQADKALYFAKNHGRNSYSFYDELNKDK